MSNIRELRAQLGHVNLLLSEAKEREKAEALAAFKEQVDLYGISEKELLTALGFAKGRKARTPAKYYDPSSGKSWTGHGPRPKWLQGRNLDDFLIRENPPQPWWPEKV
ncbi:H-NS histone family protein (plasmid) [Burkholderia vietnamiensis]|uniref:Nucleoid protein H-NS n=1 Tax=Burkholderia vietnamiensis (strain G4 / LMG 22486) TaxID=269482 RepID=A4JUE4_BURVG|nr:nucleoid protein H-NS [Burkholderia vietnamiensis G4]MCB4349940.1 H-NS histone family protein [Burkholderia vietnamiensis]